MERRTLPAQSLPARRRQGRQRAWILVAACLAGCFWLLGCDGTEADSQDIGQATVRIDASQRLNPISDLLYGHFAEFMFENIKQGLWAELLVNRGFEDIAPPPAAAHYWERYPDTRNHPNGFLLGGEAHGIREQGYPPALANRAQVLTNLLTEQRGHGIYQPRIPLREGVTYVCSVWLRATDARRGESGVETSGTFAGTLEVSLEEDRSGGEVYAVSELAGISPEWTKYQFELPVGRADPNARFALRVFGVGSIWVDQVSLMPDDAPKNFRADVLKRILALRPAFVRWPGGNVAQDYHWEWGIGPRDTRPIWVNMSWDNDPEPADFGTTEFLEFCRLVGAEPNIVVNAEGRGVTVVEAAKLRAAGKDIRVHSRSATAEEAANWVEYVNGASSSKYGALRKRDGYSEPFGVVYWEIGNEIWGDWVRGHSDASTYAANARRYIRAMKAVDPTIKIIAVGDEDPNWNRVVLEEIGGEIDFLSIHHYRPKQDDPAGYAALMARPLWYERLYDRVRSMIEEIVPGREIGVALNEWNTTFGIPRQHTMESALYGARLMNVFERQGDLIQMSAVSDLINGWPGGIIQASRHGTFTTATYSVIEAYNLYRGDWRLAAEVDCDVTHDTGDSELGNNVPALDVVASANEAGTELYVKAVNTSAEQALEVTFEIGNAGSALGKAATVTTVTAPTLDTANSFSEPNRIAARESEVAISGGSFAIELPKHSVTVIRLAIAGRGGPE